MKNLLFIPCYRCAPQIVRVLEHIRPELHHFHEILLIDNISPDGTPQVAQEKIQQLGLTNIKVVQNPANVGLGGTHKLAFQYAIDHDFDHVVILHGDDQGSLADFKQVLQEASQKALPHYVMGARFHPASRIKGYSTFRILGNLVFNCLASVLTRRVVHDLGGSGLNLFPVNLLKSHNFKRYSNDLTFHVYLLLNSFRLKQRVTFYPISWREDDQISNVRLFNQSLNLIKILGNYLFHPRRLLAAKKMEFPYLPTEWRKL